MDGQDQGADGSPQSLGGKARAAKLSPDERREIAKAGAKARWDSDLEIIPPNVRKAIASGELKIGEFTIPCAVLEGGVRVISMRGMGKALGRGYGGKDWRTSAEGAGQLPYFLVASSLKPHIISDVELVEFEPILYVAGSKSGGIAHGIPAALIPNICDVWLKAREAGALNKSQLPVAHRAETLMRGLAHVGIIALVDEATGYQERRERDELQQILSAYICPTLLPWTEKFPKEFFKEMFRVWGWPWPASEVEYKGPLGPRYAGKLIKQIIFENLPPGVLQELERLNPADGNWQRRSRMSQLLTDKIGRPHVEKLVANMTMLFRLSDNKSQFWRHYQRALGKPVQLDLLERD